MGDKQESWVCAHCGYTASGNLGAPPQLARPARPGATALTLMCHPYHPGLGQGRDIRIVTGAM